MRFLDALVFSALLAHAPALALPVTHSTTTDSSLQSSEEVLCSAIDASCGPSMAATGESFKNFQRRARDLRSAMRSIRSAVESVGRRSVSSSSGQSSLADLDGATIAGSMTKGGRSSGSSSSSSRGGSSSSSSSTKGGSSSSSSTKGGPRTGSTSSSLRTNSNYYRNGVYNGGASTAYRSGARSVALGAGLGVGAGLWFRPYGYWPGSYWYLYNNPSPVTYRNQTTNATVTNPAVCACVSDLDCGCGPLNGTVVDNMPADASQQLDINGTTYLVVNGTLASDDVTSGAPISVKTTPLSCLVVLVLAHYLFSL